MKTKILILIVIVLLLVGLAGSEGNHYGVLFRSESKPDTKPRTTQTAAQSAQIADPLKDPGDLEPFPSRD